MAKVMVIDITKCNGCYNCQIGPTEQYRNEETGIIRKKLCTQYFTVIGRYEQLINLCHQYYLSLKWRKVNVSSKDTPKMGL